eukprot:m.54282 g.54282  ORF g.54282 m.54282 type:complete len:227 (-) comp7713_c0_seq2:117-797(-)
MDSLPPSLLELMGTQSGTNMSRGFIIAEIGHGFTDEGDLEDGLKEFLHSKSVVEQTTGLILIYPTCVFFAIETPDYVFFDVLHWIEELEDQGKVFIDATILASEPVLQHEFFTLTTFTLNFATTKVSEYQTSDPVEVTAGEATLTMSKLGHYMESKRGEGKMRDILKHVSEDIPSLLVSQGMISYLLNQDTIDRVSEFLNRNTSTLSIKPDNEVIWPVPTRLFPDD